MTDQSRHDAIDELCGWLVQQGVEGAPFETVLEGCCLRLRAAGLDITRLHTTVRSYHPQYGAIAHRWHHKRGREREVFRRTTDVRTQWLQSPLYHMLATDTAEFRQALFEDPALDRFPILRDFFNEGATEYFAARVPFASAEEMENVDPDNPPVGMIVSWLTSAPGGFTDEDIADIRRVLPVLGLSLKAGSNWQMAKDLLEIYLGPDAGGRVMSGEIQRGSVETIPAAILYFDLQGFTKLTESLNGPDVIEMLNDYFGMVVQVVHDHRGNILKFMGDGALAIFSFGASDANCLAALDAAADLRDRMAAINTRRSADGLPVTGFTLGLHAGDVLYGNIGAEDRLDFTVIGSAVNTASRILDMCSHVDQTIVVSSAAANCALDQRADLVSLGKYRLRGVSERQELFTLD